MVNTMLERWEVMLQCVGSNERMYARMALIDMINDALFKLSIKEKLLRKLYRSNTFMTLREYLCEMDNILFFVIRTLGYYVTEIIGMDDKNGCYIGVIHAENDGFDIIVHMNKSNKSAYRAELEFDLAPSYVTLQSMDVDRLRKILIALRKNVLRVSRKEVDKHKLAVAIRNREQSRAYEKETTNTNKH